MSSNWPEFLDGNFRDKNLFAGRKDGFSLWKTDEKCFEIWSYYLWSNYENEMATLNGIFLILLSNSNAKGKVNQ